MIHKSITSKNTVADIKDLLIKNNFKIDYLEDIDGRRFIAAILEDVRLIDNVKI